MFRLGQALMSAQVSARLSSIPGYQLTESFQYNRKNMDAEVIRMFLRDVVEDVPDGVIDQLLTVAGTGDLKSADGTYNYTAELAKVKTPILCVSGTADQSAEPAGVKYAYEHVGSEDKTYVEMGAAKGFSGDYGHMDIVLGKNSRKEVFPMVYEWLRKRDGGGPDLVAPVTKE